MFMALALNFSEQDKAVENKQALINNMFRLLVVTPDFGIIFVRAIEMAEKERTEQVICMAYSERKG